MMKSKLRDEELRESRELRDLELRV